MNNDLISREALKKAIAEFHQKENERLHNPLWGSIGLNALNRLIDYAPAVPLPDFKEGYKQAILDGKTNFSRPQEWISVSERLPKFSGLYLVSIDNLVTVMNFTGIHFTNRGGVRVEVDAWQPLPEPYKEADNDT